MSRDRKGAGFADLVRSSALPTLPIARSNPPPRTCYTSQQVMHYISKVTSDSARVPELYQPHSTGFRRATYVDRLMGSVHMGTGICYLDPGGEIRPHLHSFEESFYVLEGSLTLECAGKTHQLQPGNFGLIPTAARHSLRNTGKSPARWLEMQ